MRIAKRIVLLMLVLTIIVGGCGCRMRTNRTNRKENTQGKIIYSMRKHLDDKYGYIDYKIKGFIGAGWDHSFDLLNLSTEIDGVEKRFHVERHKTDDGYEFKDNYFKLLIMDELEENVLEGAKNYFAECQVFCDIIGSSYPNSLTKDSSIDDFFNAKDEMKIFIYITIVTTGFEVEDEFIDTARKYIDSWKEKELATRVWIINLNEEGYESITDDNFAEVVEQNCVMEYEEDID